MNHRKNVISKYITDYDLKKGAELGVWKGDTFMYLIETHPDLFMIGVDAYKERPENINKRSLGKEAYINHTAPDGARWEHELDFKNITEFCLKYPDRTKFIRDDTDRAAEQVENESLDFVFIDADHSEEGVTNDIKNWGPKVKLGGFIIGHDYHSGGWPSVVNAVNKTLGSENITTDVDNVWIYRKS